MQSNLIFHSIMSLHPALLWPPLPARESRHSLVFRAGHVCFFVFGFDFSCAAFVWRALGPCVFRYPKDGVGRGHGWRADAASHVNVTQDSPGRVLQERLGSASAALPSPATLQHSHDRHTDAYILLAPSSSSAGILLPHCAFIIERVEPKRKQFPGTHM